MASPSGRPFVVLQSFPAPRPTTNPYLVMLRESLAEIPGLEVRTFAWRTALVHRFDVFHVHWPEILLEGRTPARRLARRLALGTLLVKLWATRTPVVRTAHNLAPRRRLSAGERALLAALDRLTAQWITINDSTAFDPPRPTVTIPHGHYRGWFSRYRVPDSVPGRLVFFGLVRRYKGIDGLVTAFRDTAAEAPGAQLRICGRPESPELADELTRLAAGDGRISMSLAFLDDADLVAEVGRAELVVLPYREMHNSGGVLAALSLGRPVLVPDNEVTRRLSAEVGPGWVFRYAGRLTGARLTGTLTALAARGEVAPPDLSGREWGRAGQDHAAAYRHAVEAARRPRDRAAPAAVQAARRRYSA